MQAFWIPAVVLSLMLGLGLCVGGERDDLSTADSAQKLVRAGLGAELENRSDARYERLRQALVDFPDDGPANWHAGRVRVGEEWLPVETAEERAAAEGRVAEYRQLRGALATTLDGQVALARWCRKQQMKQLEELHWASVLQFVPTHKEARKRLGVKEFRGRLLTLEQIAQYKKQVDEFEAANAKWRPLAARWKSAILGTNQEKREEALRELRAIQDLAAIPVMEEVLSSASDQLALEVVGVLQQFPGEHAASSLVRHAVLADGTEVRIVAAEALRSRSMFAYVPILLANLKAPIELSYYVDTWDAGSAVVFNTLQEGPDRFIERHDQSTVFSVMLSRKQLPMTGKVSGTLRAVMNRAVRTRAATTIRSAANANLEANALNERIYPALRIATGQQLPDQPREWWQWWQQHNELQASQESDKPTQRLYGHRIQTCSCFLPGTQVWTDAGAVSIEKIRLGDRVLSQNQDTGELTYKLVIDTTIRPPSPTLRIGLDGQDIAATRGHPIWVVGKGWRMAKEIEAGDYLHGLRGGVPVRYIENGPESQAYNLVVADFNSYFIGLNRILVHDNVARTPTESLLPGFQP